MVWNLLVLILMLFSVVRIGSGLRILLLRLVVNLFGVECVLLWLKCVRWLLSLVCWWWCG